MDWGVFIFFERGVYIFDDDDHNDDHDNIDVDVGDGGDKVEDRMAPNCKSIAFTLQL